MGAPGAGKGTQSQRCATLLNVPKLSTGDMLRSEVQAKTPLGLDISERINRGDLVSDEIIVGLLADRIKEKDCTKGFILDGFPRTVAQAQALDNVLASTGMSLDHIINLKVNEEDLVKRFTGRRVALGSGQTYHVENNPPKEQGICDQSGEKLVQRPDDSEDVVRHRLDVYYEQTAPVIEFYRSEKRLEEIDGMNSVNEVFEDLCTTIGVNNSELHKFSRTGSCCV